MPGQAFQAEKALLLKDLLFELEEKGEFVSLDDIAKGLGLMSTSYKIVIEKNAAKFLESQPKKMQERLLRQSILSPKEI